MTASYERGVCIPNFTWVYAWLATLMATMIAVAGAIMWVTMQEQDLTGDRRTVLTILLTVVTVPYSGLFLTDMVRGRIVRGYVTLTPHGIHHRGPMENAFIPWLAVLTVTAAFDRGPVIRLLTSDAVKRHSTSWLAFRRKPRVGLVEIRGNMLAVDPALLYYALDYYLKNPDARAELSTDAGLQRIRSGDLIGCGSSAGT
jgi:hypothetical protein